MPQIPPDLADATYKWQLQVKAPSLRMGPTWIYAKGPGRDFYVSASDFR